MFVKLILSALLGVAIGNGVIEFLASTGMSQLYACFDPATSGYSVGQILFGYKLKDVYECAKLSMDCYDSMLFAYNVMENPYMWYYVVLWGSIVLTFPIHVVLLYRAVMYYLNVWKLQKYNINIIQKRKKWHYLKYATIVLQFLAYNVARVTIKIVRNLSVRSYSICDKPVYVAEYPRILDPSFYYEIVISLVLCASYVNVLYFFSNSLPPKTSTNKEFGEQRFIELLALIRNGTTRVKLHSISLYTNMDLFVRDIGTHTQDAV